MPSTYARQLGVFVGAVAAIVVGAAATATATVTSAATAAPSSGAGVSVTASTIAYAWDSVAIGGGGFVTAVVPSRSEPDVAYARTDVGGAYRWSAREGRWYPLLDWSAKTRRASWVSMHLQSIRTMPATSGCWPASRT